MTRFELKAEESERARWMRKSDHRKEMEKSLRGRKSNPIIICPQLLGRRGRSHRVDRQRRPSGNSPPLRWRSCAVAPRPKHSTLSSFSIRVSCPPARPPPRDAPPAVSSGSGFASAPPPLLSLSFFLYILFIFKTHRNLYQSALLINIIAFN